MKKTIQVKYCGIYVDCEGTYEPAEAQTYDYPGSSSQFEIDKVFVETTDIVELLSEDQIEDLELLSLEYLDDAHHSKEF
jgi:hypothetical protein|tara:strand:+ start:399 stop:635 length:237 start_codon:yes stop_codon:yes gene_type:complete